MADERFIETIKRLCENYSIDLRTMLDYVKDLYAFPEVFGGTDEQFYRCLESLLLDRLLYPDSSYRGALYLAVESTYQGKSRK